ncbi:MAG: glycine cleavage system protein GcvH [Phycisphaerales bacterium]|nr:MAG: glycine cleavage system protein GcvH [Phycisphaerales bacterium]
MTVPSDRKYAETHEWFLIEGDIVTLGITQYAADELTDITFVELPEVGASLGAGDVVGEVESVKATSEIITAVAGTVVETNSALVDHPELINEDAFEDGWIVKLKVESTDPLGALRDAKGYQQLISAK